MEGLTEGRIVHFIVGGMHRSAVITHVWNKDNGSVNLYVFPDGSYPLDKYEYTSILFNDDGYSSYTWHWIEKV